MKLIDLLNTFDTDMRFAIVYKGKPYFYYKPQELCEDFIFLDEIREKIVTLIWHSTNLYRCIVIEIE